MTIDQVSKQRRSMSEPSGNIGTTGTGTGGFDWLQYAVDLVSSKLAPPFAQGFFQGAADVYQKNRQAKKEAQKQTEPEQAGQS